MSAAPLPRPPPQPTRLGAVPWLQPYPDALLEDLSDQSPGPEATYESREAISLAFVTALQLLPPNQRAVLLLRDVLGYRAREAADLLGLTEDAVTSALKRARATMDAARSPGSPPPTPGGPDERALLDRFVTAFTDHDVDALVSLMTDDAWVRMPPLPFEYHGPAAAHRFFTAIYAHWQRIDRLTPVRRTASPPGVNTSANPPPAACTSRASTWSNWPETGSARSPDSKQPPLPISACREPSVGLPRASQGDRPARAVGFQRNSLLAEFDRACGFAVREADERADHQRGGAGVPPVPHDGVPGDPFVTEVQPVRNPVEVP